MGIVLLSDMRFLKLMMGSYREKAYIDFAETNCFWQNSAQLVKHFMLATLLRKLTWLIQSKCSCSASEHAIDTRLGSQPRVPSVMTRSPPSWPTLDRPLH